MSNYFSFKNLALGGGALVSLASVPILAGFSSAGIVGGSIAAGIQSSIGNVAAGSAFAILQSLGSMGTFTGTIFAGSASIITGTAGYFITGKKE